LNNKHYILIKESEKSGKRREAITSSRRLVMNQANLSQFKRGNGAVYGAEFALGRGGWRGAKCALFSIYALFRWTFSGYFVYSQPRLQHRRPLARGHKFWFFLRLN